MKKSTKQVKLVQAWLQHILPSPDSFYEGKIGKKWHISFVPSTGRIRMRNTYKYGRETITFTGIIHWDDPEYWHFEFNNLTPVQKSLAKDLDLRYDISQNILDHLYEYTAGMDTMDDACLDPKEYKLFSEN